MTPARLAIGAALVLVLVAGLVLARGLPFGRAKGIDRMVTLARSRSGDITLTLMRSDGSSKVTLVDEPGVTGASASAVSFGVSYSLDGSPSNQIRSYDTQGAALLNAQRRILFWYPTSDGIEIRSADLDGGDLIKLRHASPADFMIIPASGDKLLLHETDQSTSRLLLVDLQGQVIPIVPDAVEVNGVISPDGKHIAYWQRESQGTYKLAVADEHGANPVEVARDLQRASAAFSTDSSKLFVTLTNDKDSSFQVLNADGQNPVSLSRAADDGRGEIANDRLIYELTIRGETSLFTSDLNGEDRVEIMRGANGLAWNLTPDRKRIVFLSNRNGRYALQVTDFKHEQVQDLKRGDNWIYWGFLDNGRVMVRRSSPDNNSSTFSTMQLDGSDEQILKRDFSASFFDLAGNDIVLGGQEFGGQGTLMLFGGKDPVTLDEEANSYTRARSTPSGQVIYTAQFKSSSATYTVDRNGKNKKLLFEDAAIIATGF
jgi:hypothetical protein